MINDTGAPTKRRTLLAATLGAVAASLASALGRSAPARGVNGGTILLGTSPSLYDGTGTNEATATTEIYTTMNTGLHAQSSSDFGVGLLGVASALSTTTFGVHGHTSSTEGIGVRGRATATSGTTYGMSGQSNSTAGYGVYGYAPAVSGATYGVAGRSESPTGHGVYGAALAAFGPSFGVRGEAASPDGFGVHGANNAGVGVYGASSSSSGVVGESVALGRPAVMGAAGGGGTGVQGYSGPLDVEPPTPFSTGVYGYATADPTARGVTGESTSGRGVNGVATSGRGVSGQATTGIAGYFTTPKPPDAVHTGVALQAVGRVKFDRCIGVTTIPVNANSVLVTPGIDLVSTSAVVATLQGGAGHPTTTVSRVTVNATMNTFTIYLTANNTAASPAKVAWHVFG